MSRVLRVFVDQIEAEAFFWVVSAPEGCRYGHSSLAEIAALDHDRLVVLVGGEDVMVSIISRPPGRESQSLRAVPFVLEERLAGGVDELHVVSTPVPDHPDRLLVAAISRDRISAILSRLEDSALIPDLLIADFLALPRGDDAGLVIALIPERFLALDFDGTGVAMERENLDVWLRLRGDRDGPMVVYACGGEGDEPDCLPGARIVKAPEPWPRLFSRGPDEHPLNLLRGEYRRRGRLFPSAFVLPLILALLWLGLLFVNDGIDYLRFTRQTEETRAAMTSLYKKAFPGPAILVDPRLQLEQRLKKSANAGDRFLPLLAEIAPELLRANGFHLHRLRFDGRRLVIVMRLASLAEMDRLRASLTLSPGMKVSTGQISKAGSGVRGELRIDLGGEI